MLSGLCFVSGSTIIAHAGETLVPTHKPGYQSQANTVQRHEHSGTIRHEGINSHGELVAVVESTMKDILRGEMRR